MISISCGCRGAPYEPNVLNFMVFIFEKNTGLRHLRVGTNNGKSWTVTLNTRGRQYFFFPTSVEYHKLICS